MSKYQTKRSEGFTIIEVLIVLAIAGLIMVVVFLAVPNLQRNSRNNTYRAEASNMLGAYNEVSSNKNGSVLADADEAGVLSAANTQTITTLDIQVHAAGATVSAVENAPTANQVSSSKAIIRTGAKCASSTDPTNGTATAGSSRQKAIYYMIESAGGPVLQCQNS